MSKALKLLFSLLWNLPLIIGQGYLLVKLFEFPNVVFKLGIDNNKIAGVVVAAVMIFNYMLVRLGKRLVLSYPQGKIAIGIKTVDPAEEEEEEEP